MDETVRLVTEIVTEQVASASKKMEADYRAAVSGMDRATKDTSQNIGKISTSVEGVGRIAHVAGKALSAGIGAATAAAAGAERSWIGLGTSILASFAAGGPVAGGIAIVGAAIGVASGKADEFHAHVLELSSALKAAASAGIDAFQQMGEEARRALELPGQAFARSMEDIRARSAFLKDLTPLTTGVSGNEAHAGLMTLYRQVSDYERSGSKDAEKTAAWMRDQLKAAEAIVPLLAEVKRLTESKGTFLQKLGYGGLIGKSQQEDINEAQARLQAARNALSGLIEQGQAGLGDVSKTAQANENRRLAEESLRLNQIGAEWVQKGNLLEADLLGYKMDQVQLQQEIDTLEERRVMLAGLTDAASQKETRELTLRLAAMRHFLDFVMKPIDALKEANQMEGMLKPLEAGLPFLQKEYDLARKIAGMDNGFGNPKSIAGLNAELELLKAEQAREVAIAALTFDIAEKRRKAAEENRGLVDREEAARRAQIENTYSMAVLQANAQLQAKLFEDMRALLDGIKGTLGQGLTDIIMDGITNGFKNAQQLALQLVRSLLSQVLNSIVTSGINAAFSALFGGGGGGGGGILSSLVGGGGAGAVASGVSGVGGCDT